MNRVHRRRPIHLQSKCINATTTAAARQCPKTRQLGIVLNASYKTSHGKWCCHKKPGAEEPRAVCRPFFLSHRALWSVANRFSALHRECFATDRGEGLLTRIQESNSKREEGCRFNLPSQKSRRRRVTRICALGNCLSFYPETTFFWRCYSEAHRFVR